MTIFTVSMTRHAARQTGDEIDGGTGRDVMYGGAEADTFVWNGHRGDQSHGAADRIMDFDVARR